MRSRAQRPRDVRPRRRALRRTAGIGATAGAVTVVVCVSALLTGMPQREAIEWGARRFLGARVEAVGSRFLRPIAVAHLGVYDDGPGASPRALVRIDGLRAPYRMNPSAARFFPELDVDRLAVDVDGLDPDATNYGFVARLLSQPSTGFDLTPYLPETVRIADLSAAVEMADWGGAVEGLRLEARIGGLDDAEIRLAGDAVLGRAWSDRVGVATPRIQRGTLDVRVRRAGGRLEVDPLMVDLPHVMALVGSARYGPEADGTRLEVDVDRLDVLGAAAAGALQALSPTPAAFTRMTADEGSVSLRWADGAALLDRARVAGRVEGLRVGPEEGPYYAGDAALAAEVDTAGGRADLTLDQGQMMRTALWGPPEARQVQVSVAGWSRGDLIGALPPGMRSRLDAFPALEGLDAELEATLTPEAYAGRLTLAPRLAGGSGDARVTAEGAWLRAGGETPFTGRVTATLPELEAEADASLSAEGRQTWEVRVARGDVQPLARLAGVALPSMVRGVARGEARVEIGEGYRGTASLDVDGLMPEQTVGLALSARSGEGEGTGLEATAAVRLPERAEPVAQVRFTVDEAARVRGEATLRGLLFSDLAAFAPMEALMGAGAPALDGTVRFETGEDAVRGGVDVAWNHAVVGGFALPGDAPVRVRGSYAYRPEAGTLSLDGVDVAWEEAVQARLAGWRVDPSGPSARGDAAVHHLDLARAATMLGFEGSAVGALTGTAAVRYDGGVVTATPELVATDLRVGPWVADEAAQASGTVAYSTADGRIRAEDVAVTIDAANAIRVSELTYALAGGEASAAFSLDTDLTPLADAGAISAVSGGSAKASGRWTRTGGEDVVALDPWDLRAESLVLPANWAGLVELVFTGEGTIGSGREATGSITAAEVAAGGVIVRDAGGPWRIASGELRCDQLSARLFGGLVSGSLRQRVDVAPYAGRFEGVIKDADLARFTEEFEPPYARMTGLASGVFEFGWSAEAITHLRVQLVSDRGFTLNRDILETLLLSEYTKGMIGEQTIDAVRRSVLGGSEARPFDRAELSLETQGDRYAGPLRLQSEALDLTVDLRIDKEVVTEFLQLRHETNLENIADIDFSTVQ